uniref:Radical SAM protein n=1 Tax=Ignisphaera aggregans TaxID=334771 RepID=A0A7C4JJQ9_9CREN
MMSRKVTIDFEKCRQCGFCSNTNVCYSPSRCTGCLSCYYACPYEARSIVIENIEPRFIRVYVDGVEYRVPEGVPVAEALRDYCGFIFADPSSSKPTLVCRTGGCWACALVIDGKLERTCITPVRDNMRVDTNIEHFKPLRIVHGPSPHKVGGKATPWWEVDYVNYVEAAIWVAGCNLRCPQCQNYHVTYDNFSKPLTPEEAAIAAVYCHRRYGTKGIAVSGGEPTINRRWLIEFFKEISRRIKPKVRRHLDSNGTILTHDYIDQLIEAGCNNIGIEPKCLYVETYMKITGISSRDLAEKYLETTWKAVEYIYENYSNNVYLGVGLVYNKDLISFDEIAEAGRRIVSIDKKIQVTVLDYFPTFRRRNIERPSIGEMLKIKEILEAQGLETVIVQTIAGHIGPKKHRRIEL